VSDPVFDQAYVSAVTCAADRSAAQVRASLQDRHEWSHRVLMDRVKLLVACVLNQESQFYDDASLKADALSLAEALRQLQEPSGFFRSGDNLVSPPDSSFTINDVCDVLEILRGAGEERSHTWHQVSTVLHEIADLAEPALLAGGIHTPNHRWEISAALARLHRRRPSKALASRVADWLGEGIDIDSDGMYSERSANYAAQVSNPSLEVVGDVFARGELHDCVVRNLVATVPLILPDGSVETVHSRRQDQKEVFSVAPYLTALRRWAIATGRGDLSWAAQYALEQPIGFPSTALAEMLLHPDIKGTLPPATVPPRKQQTELAGSSLVVDAGERRTLVLFGGSDYATMGRVRSGLANSPTFMRMFADDVVLDTVRLSRNFFGLGPFRPDRLERDGPGFVFHETVAASYYHPLPREHRRRDGHYVLEDEGRFAAAMAFSQRGRDVVELSTRAHVVPTEKGARIDLAFQGPRTDWALEMTFRGGDISGGSTLTGGDVQLTEGTAVCRKGGSTLAVSVAGDTEAGVPPRYNPGEEYEYLGGTDATTGRHLYVTGLTTGHVSITIESV